MTNLGKKHQNKNAQHTQKSCFFGNKTLDQRFGMRSTQTLVEIYNTHKATLFRT